MAGKSYLTRSQILDANDLKRLEVEVPEWGGTLLIRCLSGAERDELRLELEELGRINGKAYSISSKLISLCAIDNEGKSIFTEADVDALKGKSPEAIDKVALKCLELSGLTRRSSEEAARNLSQTPSDDSISG